MQALVLTAGLGTRLRPHTEKIAKPALPFLNVPMLGHSLFLLESAGLKNVVFNTHHAPESVVNSAKAIARSSYSMSFSHENDILGSGGAIQHARSLFNTDEPLFLLNGDNISLFNDALILKKLADFHSEHGALATLLCCPHAEVGKSFGGAYVGKTVSEAGFDWASIQAFSKTPIEGLEGFHFTGVLLLSPKVFSLLPQGESNILYDVLAEGIKDGGKVLAFIDRSLEWFETGDPKNFLEATRLCLRVLNQNSSQSRYLEAVLKRFTPGWDNYKKEKIFSFQPLDASLKIAPETLGLVGRGAKIAQGAQLKDFVVIGENCSLADGSQMEAAVLFSRQRLEIDEKLHSSLR